MAARKDTLRSEELLAHAARLRRLAARLAGEGADDLVQDAWVSALQRAPRDERPLWPWLARVLANRARNLRRDDARRRGRETERATSEHASSPAPEPREVASELEAQRALVEAVLALDEPERTVVVLRWFHELDSRAIGERLAVPPATVRWRLARAMQALRERLDERFGERGAWAVLFVPLAQRAPLAGGAAIPGVLAMSAWMKWGAAALIAVALAGLAWVELEVSPETGSDPREPIAALEALPQSTSVASLDDEIADAASTGIQSARSSLHAEDSKEAPTSATESAPRADARLVTRLVTEDGSPVRDGSLRGERRSELYVARADADGRVELALPAGMPAWRQELLAEAPGRATRAIDANLSAGSTTELGELVLGPGGSIHGRVVDGAGRALAGAAVCVLPAKHFAKLRDGESVYFQRYGFGAGYTPRTQSGADGTFELEGACPGTLCVGASMGFHRFAWTAALELAADVPVEGVELVLERLRREDRITGVVLDPEGRSLAGARVAARAGDRGATRQWSVLTDPAGRFELLALSDGPHALEASDREHRFGSIGIEGVLPGTQDLVLRLTELRELRIRALDSDGRAVERFAVSVHAVDVGGSKFDPVEFHPEGVAEVALDAFGSYVDVRAPGFRRLRQGPFDVGTTLAEVAFELEALPAIAGRVTIDGVAASNALIELRRACDPASTLVNGFPARSMPTSDQATADADGRFSLATEEEGELFLRASAPGRASLDVGPWDFGVDALPQELALELTRGGAIEGRVLRSDDRDPAGTIVGLSCGDGSPRTQRVGADGSFRFEALPPGNYAVTRRDEEIDPNGTEITTWPGHGRSFDPNCTVVEGRTTRFDLELTGGR